MTDLDSLEKLAQEGVALPSDVLDLIAALKARDEEISRLRKELEDERRYQAGIFGDG